MQAIRFMGPFGFLLSIPLLYAVSPIASLATPLALLLALLGTEQIGRKPDPATVAPRSGAFHLLPVLYIPLQLMVIVWAAWMIARSPFSFAGFADLTIAVGVCTGIFGVLAAHELVHSRSRRAHRLGLLMLLAMSYPQFRIAHVYGHHRHAATERDASTARLGESFYSFLIRTVATQLFGAWNFECQRTRRQQSPYMHNRVVQGGILMAALYGILLFFVPRAAAFLAAESAVAILVLELFNYIAHYGVVRQLQDGTFERLGPHHSWNSSGIGNLLIFNMGHHSDHHSAPERSFEGLQRAPEGRELPFGYAGSILLALVPPLWRAVMDHRIAPAPAAEFDYNANRGPAPIRS
jgi:alkane 1-monooxygenase